MKATEKYYALVPETTENASHSILESYMVEMGQPFVLSCYKRKFWYESNLALQDSWIYTGRFFLLVWLEGEIASAPAKAAISLN